MGDLYRLSGSKGKRAFALRLNQEKIQCYAACLPVSSVCRMKKTRYNNVGIICRASGY